MSHEIKAPQFPESIAEGEIATWHKQLGEAVKRDELIVDIETDKVVLEVLAPADGVLSEVLFAEGDTVESQQLIARLSDAGAATVSSSATPAAQEPASSDADSALPDDALSPAVRRMLSEHNVELSSLKGSGRGGRITKQDVQDYLEAQKTAAPVAAKKEIAATPEKAPAQVAAKEVGEYEREERRVPMTRLRQRVAQRLLDAQHNAAMLTTFNEVNMQPIMAMRKSYQSDFEKAHGVRLGFMSFFVRAATEALKRYPSVNASIDETDVVYHGYFDVGVAVSSPRGLVVPVIRDADCKGLAEVETQIIEYGKKANDGKLSIEEMSGGTFTISNGGVFGSLLSTPILNPPQTAILGMHKIQDRPMAVDGKVEILPMMYLALSYDHRLIDGKEAVQFLSTIKQFIEDPSRLLLDI